MDFFTIFWIVLAGAIVVGILSAIVDITTVNKNTAAMEKKLKELHDFTATQTVLGKDGATGLAVDEGRKKIALIKKTKNDVDLKIITYRELLSSEIFEDGETVTKTSRGSQLGGALLGGIALGGVGAIIGGLSGKTKSDDKVRNIHLRVTVNNISSPLHDISFMTSSEGSKGFSKTAQEYKDGISQARHWHALIEVLIRKADSEDAEAERRKRATNEDNSSGYGSLADELMKLSKLKDKGILSEEEFAQQKGKLLS